MKHRGVISGKIKNEYILREFIEFLDNRITTSLIDDKTSLSKLISSYTKMDINKSPYNFEQVLHIKSIIPHDIMDTQEFIKQLPQLVNGLGQSFITELDEFHKTNKNNRSGT